VSQPSHNIEYNLHKANSVKSHRTNIEHSLWDQTRGEGFCASVK